MGKGEERPSHDLCNKAELNDKLTIINSVTNNQIVKSFGGADYQPLKFSPQNAEQNWATEMAALMRL